MVPPPETVAYSGPFFKIPFEIKSKIFGHCIESSEPDSKSAPSCWVRSADSGGSSHEVAPSRYTSLLELLRIWLTRSATRPLNLALHYQGIRIRPTPAPIHFLLLQHSHRWEHVILCLPYSDLVELFEKCTGSLPLLRALAITLPHYEPVLPPLSFEVLRHSSLLQTLEMSLNCVQPLLSGVPWTQLTSFNGHHLPAYNALDVLRNSPALRECRMKIIQSDKPYAALHLPELRVFHVDAIWISDAFAFLARLTLPGLQRLQCPRVDNHSVTHILAFLSRSLCPLTHFSTVSKGHGGGSLEGEESFVDLFTALPHLVEMKLDVGLSTPNFVASLLRSHYLPQLTRLKIWARQVMDYEVFVNMLESRTGTNVQGTAELRSFAWSYEHPFYGSGAPSGSLSPELVERMKVLIRRGIEMELNDSAFNTILR
ncbi:hypothetical protein C8F04DRAFT_1196899 [Mycena alexandri]|uniref:Uncharacterized protein n=1 Tax=Mycena alexandri TaxID=1745969 RepID=A0AAD6S373_9AGAR|nr:hypothetical protein C8F04DRAFT_1196899 [Mycena alexandri]